jgi:hypothetical protein
MFGSSFRDSKRNFVMRNKTVLGPRGIHSKWVVSNKNFQSLDLKDSKYMLYNAMMAFLIDLKDSKYMLYNAMMAFLITM